MADSVANRDEARKCLAVAANALRDGDLDKAEKFALKAKRLYASMEAESLLESVEAARFRASSSRPQANGTHSRHEHGHATANGHHHAGGSDQGQPSSTGPKLPPRDGVRHRAPPAAAPQEDKGTPEQKQMVQAILKAKDFYEILSIGKDATDDDIKKAYRKLALKLHPDKNQALHSEDAFKAVSKAFSCLSDPNKRAYYDRTGYESSSAAVAAQAAQRSPSGHQRAGHTYYADDIDPEEIFNMFFGGAFPGQARVFRAQFGGGPRRHHQQQQGDPAQAAEAQQRHAMLSMLQFLPVLLIIVFTFFSGSQTPAYSLSRDKAFPVEVMTSRLAVPYYVKSQAELEKSYPPNSHARFKLERGVESAHYERLEARCQQERLLRHRAWSWGNREQARAMKLESCDEMEAMNEKLGAMQRQSRGSMYS